MPKVICKEVEWFPVLQVREFEPTDDADDTAEFTDEELAEIRRVFAEFDDWQAKIGERWRLAGVK